MKFLPFLLLVALLGCTSPINDSSAAAGNRFARHSTPELQAHRQQVYDSVSSLHLLSGMPAITRERYLADRRDDLAAIESELNRRFENGDLNARLKPFTGLTNTVKGAAN